MNTYKNESEPLKSFDAVLRAALELPAALRAQLVDRLIESLDGPASTRTEAAWVEEIERRVRDIDEGRVQLIPGEEVLARLRSRFKQ